MYTRNAMPAAAVISVDELDSPLARLKLEIQAAAEVGPKIFNEASKLITSHSNHSNPTAADLSARTPISTVMPRPQRSDPQTPTRARL